eukprot:gene31013-biopygen5618
MASLLQLMEDQDAGHWSLAPTNTVVHNTALAFETLRHGDHVVVMIGGCRNGYAHHGIVSRPHTSDTPSIANFSSPTGNSKMRDAKLQFVRYDVFLAGHRTFGCVPCSGEEGDEAMQRERAVNIASLLIQNVLKELPYVFGSAIPQTLKFRGTVKLHGTHSDIVRHFITGTPDFVDTIQSRNRILSVDNDNQGCHMFLTAKKYSDMFDRIQAIHGADIRSNIVVCGEYCGKGVQSKVALCKLAKMFVIFAIRIDYEWVDMTKYSTVFCQEEWIFNIMNFPTYEVEVDMSDTQPAQDYMADLTNAVDAECPFAYQLAGVKGGGEGIVWTCVDHPSSRLWFKTKGKTHCTAVTKQAVPSQTEYIKTVTEFVESVTTESRLSQGIECLVEQGVELRIHSVSEFSSWVCRDVFKEERDSIEENGFNVNDVRKALYRKAGNWYKQRVATA